MNVNLKHYHLDFTVNCHMLSPISGPLKMITLTTFQITLTQFNNEILF